MKNITKILLALAALFILGGIMVSCSQEVTADSTMVKTAEKTSPSSTSPTSSNTNTTPTGTNKPGKIVAYYRESSKRLDAWRLSSTDYEVSTGKVQDSDFRALDTLMEGKIIYGLSFEGISRIEGAFSKDGVETGLQQLRFTTDLEYIGEDVFRTCYRLFEVDFAGSAPEVEETAFPDAEEFNYDCVFSVLEGSDGASWVKALKPFITGSAKLGITSKITLKTNETEYAEKYAEFGTPKFANDATELSGNYYLGRVLNVQTPTNAGYTFLGFYADSDTTATQIIDADGKSIPNVTSYTDSDGAWIREEDTELYAHWKEEGALSYYEKGAAFLKEYIGLEIPKWDNLVGANNDNSADWTTETGMHFLLNSNISSELYTSLTSYRLADTLGYFYSPQHKSVSIQEDEYECLYTTSTWFAYDLPEDKQTDDYKKCRIILGTGKETSEADELVITYPYISLDVSFIKSAVGTLGSAGGYIFYDVDEDNNSENEGAGPDGLKSDVCGWKFLETAAADYFTTATYIWFNQAIDTSMTSQNIGKGEDNTIEILSVARRTVENIDFEYAAEVCAFYRDSNGYRDYFMPSLKELEAIRNNLFIKGIGGFTRDQYWSSSENNKFNALVFDFAQGEPASAEKTDARKIRPVRKIYEFRD